MDYFRRTGCRPIKKPETFIQLLFCSVGRTDKLPQQRFHIWLLPLEKVSDEVPEEYRVHDGDRPDVQVADFISGMTDRYAVSVYESLKVPRSWRRR